MTVFVVNVLEMGGAVVLPERNDQRRYRLIDAQGRLVDVDQDAIRRAVKGWCADLDIGGSVHARRHVKWRNDMEWLSFVDRNPGADRSNWGAAPHRCAHHGYTTLVDGVECRSDAGREWLDFYRYPF